MWHTIEKLEKCVTFFNKAVMVVLGILLPVLITTGVFFRYILNKDFFGVEEIEIYIAIWLYFIGAALASYRKVHITADLTQSMIKSFEIRKTFAILSTLITAVIAIVITYCTIDLVVYAHKMTPISPVWQIPLITEYLVVLYSLTIMSIYAARDCYKAITRKREERQNLTAIQE